MKTVVNLALGVLSPDISYQDAFEASTTPVITITASEDRREQASKPIVATFSEGTDVGELRLQIRQLLDENTR